VSLTCDTLSTDVKSIYTPEYKAMYLLLKEYRERAGLTQSDLSELVYDDLGWCASIVGKVERGERRLDALEIRVLVNAMNVPMVEFWAEFERRLEPG
jgi:transcriptional regulator with XRE-family HTH domain